jgi:hypothetical protein
MAPAPSAAGGIAVSSRSVRYHAVIMYPQFEADYYFTERQITIVIPSGTRIRVDAIGLDVEYRVTD